MRKWVIGLALLISSASVYAPEQRTEWFPNKELKCLIDNVYFEARGEPLRGQIEVARVTLNRAKNKSICAVVYAKSQFSWTAKKAIVRDQAAWAKAEYAAFLAKDHYSTATHFHHININPSWASSLRRLYTINNHTFYEN